MWDLKGSLGHPEPSPPVLSGTHESDGPSSCRVLGSHRAAATSRPFGGGGKEGMLVAAGGFHQNSLWLPKLSVRLCLTLLRHGKRFCAKPWQMFRMGSDVQSTEVGGPGVSGLLRTVWKSQSRVVPVSGSLVMPRSRTNSGVVWLIHGPL